MSKGKKEKKTEKGGWARGKGNEQVEEKMSRRGGKNKQGEREKKKKKKKKKKAGAKE